jgi:hypothetical protein
MCKLLEELKLGDRVEGSDFQLIDAGGFMDIARVVVSIQGEKGDFAPGVALVHQILALPKLIAALRLALDQSDSDAAMGHGEAEWAAQAREAMKAAFPE